MKKPLTKLKPRPVSSIPDILPKTNDQKPFRKIREPQRLYSAYERQNSVTIRVQFPDGPGGNYEGL